MEMIFKVEKNTVNAVHYRMTDYFRTVLQQYKIEGVVVSIRNQDSQYILNSQCDSSLDEWKILITDGVNIWKCKMDQDALKQHRELNGMENEDKYFICIRDALQKEEISITKNDNDMIVHFGKDESTLSYDLHSLPYSERNTEMMTLLMFLTNQVTRLRHELSESNESRSPQKKQKLQSFLPQLTDFETYKRGGSPLKTRKKEGMSLINPGSKKPKLATGIQFD